MHSPSTPLALAMVLIAALYTASFVVHRFLGSHRLLWNSAIHDRNAHLYAALCLAMDVRIGDAGHLFPDLDSFRTWPPLHGLLAAACLLIGGGDERWAVLPSLAAWVSAAVFGFLLARRASPRGGSMAGLLASLFILASPGHRLYATDVMLESLGACLTLACLYYYLAALQDRTPASHRHLAIALTLLFFEKYNYWLLVAIGLSADQIWTHRQQVMARVRRGFRERGEARAWIVRQLKHPLTYPLTLLLIAMAAIILTGGTDVEAAGRRIQIRSNAYLATVAYVLFLVRIAPWYRRTGRARLREMEDRHRQLVMWHVWPMVIWFVWPHRLYSFLWTSSPASNAGEFPHRDLLGGYAYYGAALVQNYHANPVSALVAISLFLVATQAGCRGHLRPGATAILWFVGLAFVLTVHHPNRKSRFLHSWIPAIWAGAGIGAGVLLQNRRKELSVRALAGECLGIAALAMPQIAGLAAPAHASTGDYYRTARSILDVTDDYLPDLASCRRAAVFSNMPMKELAQWTYLQRYRRAQRLETDIRGFDPVAADNRACFDRWLATTTCDTVVYVEFAPGTAYHVDVPGCAQLPQYGRMMESQSRFARSRRRALRQQGCTVTVWHRGSPARGATIRQRGSPAREATIRQRGSPARGAEPISILRDTRILRDTPIMPAGSPMPAFPTHHTETNAITQSQRLHRRL